MSETKWTSEQWDAITEKGCGLLVAAAAGAGKTAVLVERIIKKITDEKNPVDIDRLLIVTFTNAAATEMRERIADAISSALEKNPDSRLIQRQLALLGKSSITTIHSFCMEVIRSNFQALSIDPGFRIADETESSLLKLEALNDLFEEQYEKENNAEFFELLECYGGNRDDQTLMDMVLSLYTFIQSSPWPMSWLNEMTGRLNVPDDTDFGETPWGKVLLSSVRLELEGIRDMLLRAIGMIKTGYGLEKYLAVYHEDLNYIETILTRPMSWDTLFYTLQSLDFSRLPTAARDADKEKQEIVKKLRDDVKARIKKLVEKTITADSAAIAKDLRTLHPLMQCLSDLVKGLEERYAKKKSRKSVVDFNDLEHYCLGILTKKEPDGSFTPSDIALGYRDRFFEILVDEYQDSNLVQEMMIGMISRTDTGNPNVFMVGDVKQSIYRFRQARPELFLEKYNSYSPDKGSPFRKILLFKNFRSRKEVVDAVNFLFKQMMSVNIGELDYTDLEALNAGAVFAECEAEAVTGGKAELHVIQTGSREEPKEGNETEESANEEQEPEEILDNIQCEARLVADRIHELMDPDENGKSFCVYDKSKKHYRKVEYKDIVILLRTTKNWSDVFADELSDRGIPAFADAGSGFFKTIEIQVVLSLLQIIDNPLQDIPLLSVLRSPMFSFTTDELTDIRLTEPRGLLYEALKKLALIGSGEASRKASVFLENLKKWREMSLYLSTDQLIWRLYNDTGYYGMVGALPAGEQRQANLRILFERARQFEETSYKGLFNFINFIDKLKSSRGDLGSAKILSENDNVVRIMSIHKSKGLEFPVVFLSGCGKKFNLQDMNRSILFHQDLGFGPEVVDARLRLSWPSAAKQAIREKIRGETLSEEMRILYVALTRAREKLIITGGLNDAGKALSKWAASAASDGNKLPDYEMLKGNNYLDWIGPALLRHRECADLRNASPVGSDGCPVIEDPSQWRVKVWNKSDVIKSGPTDEREESDLLSWLNTLDAKVSPDLQQEIERRLDWKYAYKRVSGIPAKVSVTELKRRFNSQLAGDNGELPGYLPTLVKKPMFLEEKKGLSAAEKGTVLHFVMQHLDFSDADIAGQISRMAAKDLLTLHQAESIDIARIQSFLGSVLGRRLLASRNISREIPFNMEISCRELFKDLPDHSLDGETILLQGVIDCYFEEADGIILVDYKTDYVPAGAADSIKERYRLQIEYYARALELLTGRKVKEKYIYLFWNGEVIDY